MHFQSIKFVDNQHLTPTTTNFYKDLKKRVSLYFKNNNISRFGNSSMFIKTIFMLSLYLVPYILILTVVSNTWLSLLLWTVAGFGMAGVGLSVMHDANHGAYSKHAFINKTFGFLSNMVGGSDINWRIQHNVLHHTYTNIDGMDEDIDVDGLMRFSPNQERLKIHRYQHIYAWFLYGLLTINWFFRKDYQQIYRYKKMSLLSTQNISYGRALTVIILTKIIYAFFMIVLPILISPSSWYVSLIGFFVMQFIAGFLLSVIFQTAHVVPSSEFPQPDSTGSVSNEWAINQLYNTSNFAPKSCFMSWYIGGLNFQIEHHLFPNICHIHYKQISKIVKQTAIEYNLPYYSYSTFFQAVRDHFKLLQKLGRADVLLNESVPITVKAKH